MEFPGRYNAVCCSSRSSIVAHICGSREAWEIVAQGRPKHGSRVGEVMGVCNAVAALAKALADSGQVVGTHEALLVYLLRAMPLYSEVRRLDLWESAFLGIDRL